MEGRHITCKSHSTNLFLLVLLLSIKLLVTLELTLEVAGTFECSILYGSMHTFQNECPKIPQYGAFVFVKLVALGHL